MNKIKERLSNLNHKSIWLDSMIGMTWGFIATLVVGTIIGLFGINQNNQWSHMVNSVKATMSYLTPFAIGVGVAYKAKLKPLQILAVMIGAGIVGHSSFIPHYSMANENIVWSANLGFDKGIISLEKGIGLPGDVFGAWITSVMWVYIFKIFIWEFALDIILIPLLGGMLGLLNSMYLTYVTSSVVVMLEWIVEHSANKSHTFGILLAPAIGLIMGLALSMPTSSAAIALAIKLHGDAATAAMAATAAQMISFGVLTYIMTNSLSKSLAVGFGTSMLQMKNFMRKPIILVIPAIVSMIAATVGTAAVPLDFIPGKTTSGMGSCALYGQIFTLQENGWSDMNAWLHVSLIQLALPVLVTIPLGIWFKNKNIIKQNEMEF